MLSEVGVECSAGVEHWERVGDHPTKGLAIASFASPIEAVDCPAGRWSIRATIDSGLGLLRIWSNPEGGKSSQTAYAAEVSRAIEDSDAFLREHPCIVAADFNQFSYAPEFAPIVDLLGSPVRMHHERSPDLNPEPADYEFQISRPGNPAQSGKQGFCPGWCPASPVESSRYREVWHPLRHPDLGWLRG